MRCVPKINLKKFDVPRERGILLGYARKRIKYRIYDLSSRKIIEERTVKFNESLKGSNYFSENNVNEPWYIEVL